MKWNRTIAMAAVLMLFTAGMTGRCWGAEMKEASGNLNQVASAEEMAAAVDIEDENMEPIYADSLNEGTYAIEVLSSSSMFRIADCQLTVKDGTMNAVMKIESDSYLRLFMGTGAEAVAAEETEYITFELDAEGNQLYTVPVEALDRGIECAAWSRRREKWYDRTLVFSAAALPKSALKDGMILTAEEIGLEDGIYLVEVTLEGGSGKTTVENPVTMTVTDGSAVAVITIKSPHYDYVLVDGKKYEKINTEGNSTFEIPVGGFDWKMPVIANSMAMGTSHEIDYTLYFDADTIREID